jgi:succinylglutamate desuccinylase
VEPGDLEPISREIGSYSTGVDGPMLVALGGVHGNEPAGVIAARRVLQELEDRQVPMRGRFQAIAGSLVGLQRQVRYVEHDLNRIWSKVEIERARATGPEHFAWEQRDQAEILAVLEDDLIEAARHRTPVHVLDLHSTSADGPPFTIIGDTLQNRRIAFALGVPVILGLEENVDGTLLGWLAGLGHVAVGIEGGQHDLLSTVDNHESALWIALVTAGLVEERHAPDLPGHRARLAATATGIPPVVEIRYRHGLEAGEPFEMVGQLPNFAEVQHDQLLARSGRSGDIRALESGILLLPRYQGQGDDGFFLGRRVNPLWLSLSAWLRRLNVETLLRLLPGVFRPPEGHGELYVNRRIARWFSNEVFHLLGYRRNREQGPWRVFSRRLERPIWPE